MFSFLEVDPLEIPPKLGKKVLPAGMPRNRSITMIAKKIAKAGEQVGLAKLKGKVKTSPFIRNLLYKPFTDSSRPTMPPQIKAHLRAMMTAEIQLLDRAADTDFCGLWNYPKPR